MDTTTANLLRQLLPGSLAVVQDEKVVDLIHGTETSLEDCSTIGDAVRKLVHDAHAAGRAGGRNDMATEVSGMISKYLKPQD